MSRTSAIWSVVLMSLMALTIAALSVMNWNMQKDLEECALEVQSICPATTDYAITLEEENARINLQLRACRKILDAQMQFLEEAR